MGDKNGTWRREESRAIAREIVKDVERYGADDAITMAMVRVETALLASETRALKGFIKPIKAGLSGRRSARRKRAQ